MSRKLAPPPSSTTGALGQWLREIHTHLEAQPNFSLISIEPTATPNSSTTGLSGDLALNIGSGSTDGRLWVLGGAARSALTQQGWVQAGVAGVASPPSGVAGGVLSGTYPNPGFAASISLASITITGAPTWSSTQTLNTSGTSATVTSATQAAITTAANLTTIGTLVAGAVPASLVTAGTFGTGAYAFDSVLGVGTGSTLSYVGLWVRNNNLGTDSGNAYGIISGSVFTSATTGAGRALQIQYRTAAASFTMAEGTGLYVDIPTLGAGSTITTGYGIYVANQALAGTNYAIYTNAGLVRFGGALESPTHTLTAGSSLTVASGQLLIQGVSGQNVRINGANFYVSDFAGTTDYVIFAADQLSLQIKAAFAAGLSLSGATAPTHGIQFGTSAPGTLANGQLWYDGTNLKARLGGATVTVQVA